MKTIRVKEQSPVLLESYKLSPNKMQVEFVENVKDLIDNDEHMGLLISATGTGKTYMSWICLLEIHSNIQQWIKVYQKYGKEYFYQEHRGNPSGNPFSALHTRKNLSKLERLELENLKLRIENERLKKATW